MRSFILALAICASGCGARTGLHVHDAAVPVADGGRVHDAFVLDAPLVADAGTDAGSDSGSAERDAGVDAGPPDAGSCDAPLLTIGFRDRFCGIDLLLGEQRKQVLSLHVRNSADRAMRIVRWQVDAYRGDPADCAPRTISRVRLRNSATGESYGQASLTLIPGGGGNFHAVIRPDRLRIPVGEMDISVELDFAAFTDGGCSGWVTTIGFASWVDIDAVWEDGTPIHTDCVCSCLAGTPFYLQTGFLDVHRARISVRNADISRTVVATGEQYLGGFTVRNEPNVGSYTATVGVMNLGLRGIFGGDRRPRTLRLYRDAIAPGNLVASTVLAELRPTETTWRDEDFADTDIASGMIREFLVTLESDGVVVGSQLTLDVVGMTWSDGFARSGSLACGFPITGSTATFAPTP